MDGSSRPPHASGTGQLSVIGNVVRGSNGPRDAGLRFRVGGGDALVLAHYGNNVLDAGTTYETDGNVMSVDPV